MEPVMSVLLCVMGIALFAVATAVINTACSVDFTIYEIPHIFCPDDSSVPRYADEMQREGIPQREICEFVQTCKDVVFTCNRHEKFLQEWEDFQMDHEYDMIANFAFWAFVTGYFVFGVDGLVEKIVIAAIFSVAYFFTRHFFAKIIQCKIRFPSYHETPHDDLIENFLDCHDYTWKGLLSYFEAAQKNYIWGYMNNRIQKLHQQQKFIKTANAVRWAAVALITGLIV